MIAWTERALRDVDDSLAHMGVLAGERLIRQIVRAIERLDRFPLSGRVIPELTEEAIYREVIAGEHRVAYWVLEDRVEILAVLHGRRLMTIDLLREREEVYGRSGWAGAAL